jgi:pentatricopeptide repeat protein
MFLLSKTYELAWTHEKFGLMLQILEWEKRLNMVMDEPSRLTELIVEEEKKVLKMYAQVMEMESIFSKAKEFKRQYGFVKGKLKTKLEREIVNAPNLPKIEECLSEKAVYYFNFIHALYFWMILSHRLAFQYSRQLLASKVRVVLPGDYVDGIFEHITSSVCMARFEDALKGIELGVTYVEEQKLNQSHAFMLRMFAYQRTYQLIIYNYMGDREKLCGVIRETEAKLKLYENMLSFETKQVILGNLMNAYMGTGDLEKADEIWNSMLNKQGRSIRRDIYADLHLFRLFSLVQAKSYVLLQPAAASALRYFKKEEDSKKTFEVEAPIATLLSKELDYANKDILKTIMEKIMNIVQEYISGLRNIINFQEHYTRYIIWGEAILNGEPYCQAASRWYHVNEKNFKTSLTNNWIR